MDRSVLIALLFAFFAFIILLAVFQKPEPSGGPSFVSSKPHCAEGSEMNCSFSSCKGKQYCVGGVWTECRTAQACRPGEPYPVDPSGSCSAGYKYCNECGDGFVYR
ncbi:MAG: hypothetical protein ACP5NX_03485 [Candidatus Bilamarchaeaceae archaeon]